MLTLVAVLPLIVPCAICCSRRDVAHAKMSSRAGFPRAPRAMQLEEASYRGGRRARTLVAVLLLIVTRAIRRSSRDVAHAAMSSRAGFRDCSNYVVMVATDVFLFLLCGYQRVDDFSICFDLEYL